MILGIDEVGRGPWAGPLVVGAVVLGDAVIDGLTDSKKLTKKKREALDTVIRQQVAGYGLGWVSPEELDDIGLSAALKQATIRAVSEIHTPYDEIIIDGTINFLKETAKGAYVTTLAKADLLIPAVSAASIIAKVARDRYMEQQANVYPNYGFEKHVGYGTAQHQLALKTHGATPLHRFSFAPLAPYRTETTKQKGDRAEKRVAAYLVLQGHTILARNWRTKVCELDIVSVKQGVIYATEVRYRRLGGGQSVMTPKKVDHLLFSLSMYVTMHRLAQHDQRLLVADVDERDRCLLVEVE